MRDDNAAEYVIVGGGIYGAAVAWELARRGAEVLLLEAETVASGASGGPGKRGVRANGRDVRELPLMRLAYSLWPALAGAIGAPTGYERLGNLELLECHPDSPQDVLEGAAARRWLQEQHGIPTELLSREEVRRREPAVDESVIGALFCPLDGVADHTATTRGLAQAAARLGATVREHVRVSGLIREGDRVTAISTAAGERIGVRRELLLLSNTHVPEFVAAQLGVTLPVWPILPQTLVTEPAPALPVRHLIGHAYRTLAIKPLSDGRIMLSGGWSGQWDAARRRGETIPEQVRRNVAEAVAVYPALRDVAVEVADASRPESRCVDDVPILDRLPGADNMLLGTGWSGHGFAISLAVAKLLADWVTQGERPALLAPFAYTRFTPPAP